MRLSGLILIIFGGIMEGLFSLPARIAPKWAWENIWGAGSLAALVLVPWPLALLTIPHLGAVYASVPLSSIFMVVLFGAGWGFGGIFFGLGVDALGISLGTSLIMGLIAIGGSVIPMMLEHGSVPAGGGKSLLPGIAVMIAGLCLCAKAGSLKAREEWFARTTRSRPFGRGLFYCVAAGVFSGLVNFALVFGSPVAKPAIKEGINPATANNAIWALAFTANYIVNIVFCIRKGFKNGTMHQLLSQDTIHYWALAAGMGLLWAGGIVVYGRGASIEGSLGPILGFPIMLIMSILAGNVAGAILGEWRGTDSRSKLMMSFGVSALALAIMILGFTSYATR
jgi:L-rhamnose-H+ transport protein